MAKKKEIYLYAGEYFFGKAGTSVHTLLGSCISITLWHPRLKIGGMCHFALPRTNGMIEGDLNPRYAEDCLALFKKSAKRKNTKITEYQAKIFGGGNMNPQKVVHLDDDNRTVIGAKNTAIAFQLLIDSNIEVLVADAGEFGYRKIIFDIESGYVWVNFTRVEPLAKPQAQ